MRAIVCGGRDLADRDAVFRALDELRPTEIAEGGARGADGFARAWAMSRGVPWTTFPAAWITHGKAAGPIRNQMMLDEFKPDAVIAFPGGVGTRHMVRIAERAGVRVIWPAAMHPWPAPAFSSFPAEPTAGHQEHSE